MTLPRDGCDAFDYALGVSRGCKTRPEDSPSAAGSTPESSGLAQQVRALIDADILIPASATTLPAESIPASAARSLVDTFDTARRPQARIGSCYAFACALRTARRDLRHRSFDAMIRNIERVRKLGPHRHPTPSTQHLGSIVDAFRWFRLWTYTSANQCLFDSVVLVHFLARLGIPATLVLGVQTKPFSAHAWVQRDDLVLNDTIEKVHRYTPIMAA